MFLQGFGRKQFFCWFYNQFRKFCKINKTVRDTFLDICLYREAAKVKVRKAIVKRTDYVCALCSSILYQIEALMSTTHKTEEERKRLFTLLKYDRWMKDSYLRCMMRKYYKHGKTEVDNQIILDTQCYTAFERNGQAWIKVMGLERGKRIVLLLLTRTFGIGCQKQQKDCYSSLYESPPIWDFALNP
mgnify:CR=1 FL=1